MGDDRVGIVLGGEIDPSFVASVSSELSRISANATTVFGQMGVQSSAVFLNSFKSRIESSTASIQDRMREFAKFDLRGVGGMDELKASEMVAIDDAIMKSLLHAEQLANIKFTSFSQLKESMTKLSADNSIINMVEGFIRAESATHGFTSGVAEANVRMQAFGAETSQTTSKFDALLAEINRLVSMFATAGGDTFLTEKELQLRQLVSTTQVAIEEFGKLNKDLAGLQSSEATGSASVEEVEQMKEALSEQKLQIEGSIQAIQQLQAALMEYAAFSKEEMKGDIMKGQRDAYVALQNEITGLVAKEELLIATEKDYLAVRQKLNDYMAVGIANGGDMTLLAGQVERVNAVINRFREEAFSAARAKAALDVEVRNNVFTDFERTTDQVVQKIAMLTEENLQFGETEERLQAIIEAATPYMLRFGDANAYISQTAVNAIDALGALATTAQKTAADGSFGLAYVKSSQAAQEAILAANSARDEAATKIANLEAQERREGLTLDGVAAQLKIYTDLREKYNTSIANSAQRVEQLTALQERLSSSQEAFGKLPASVDLVSNAEAKTKTMQEYSNAINTAVNRIRELVALEEVSGGKYNATAAKLGVIKELQASWGSGASKTAKEMTGLHGITNPFLRDVIDSMKSIVEFQVKWNLGLTAIFGSINAVKAAAAAMVEYEQALAHVQVVTQSNAADISVFSDRLLEVAKVSKFGIKEITEAMLTFAQAGFTASELTTTIEGVNQLAVATVSDLKTAVDMVSVSLRAFGLEASQTGHVVDVLTATVNFSRATLPGLQQAFNSVASTGAILEYKIEDLSAAIGTLSNAGLNMSTAGTGLRYFLHELESPTGRVIDALNKLGLTVYDVSPETNTLAQILAKLADAGADAGFAMEAFGKRGGNIASALITNVTAYGALQDKIASTGDIFKKVDEVMHPVENTLKNIKARAETLSVTLSKVVLPVFHSLLDAVVKTLQVLDKFTSWFAGDTMGAAATRATLLGLAVGAVSAAVLKLMGVNLVEFIANFTMALRAGEAQSLLMEVATKRLTAAQIGLKAATIGSPMMIIAAVVGVAMTALHLYSSRTEAATQATQALYAATAESSEAFKKNESAIQKQIESAEKYAKILGDSTAAEEAKLRSSIELQAMIPDLTTSYNKLGQAIVGVGKGYDQNNRAVEQYIKSKRDELVTIQSVHLVSLALEVQRTLFIQKEAQKRADAQRAYTEKIRQSLNGGTFGGQQYETNVMGISGPKMQKVTYTAQQLEQAELQLMNAQVELAKATDTYGTAITGLDASMVSYVGTQKDLSLALGQYQTALRPEMHQLMADKFKALAHQVKAAKVATDELAKSFSAAYKSGDSSGIDKLIDRAVGIENVEGRFQKFFGLLSAAQKKAYADMAEDDKKNFRQEFVKRLEELNVKSQTVTSSGTEKFSTLLAGFDSWLEGALNKSVSHIDKIEMNVSAKLMAMKEREMQADIERFKEMGKNDQLAADTRIAAYQRAMEIERKLYTMRSQYADAGVGDKELADIEASISDKTADKDKLLKEIADLRAAYKRRAEAQNKKALMELEAAVLDVIIKSEYKQFEAQKQAWDRASAERKKHYEADLSELTNAYNNEDMSEEEYFRKRRERLEQYVSDAETGYNEVKSSIQDHTAAVKRDAEAAKLAPEVANLVAAREEYAKLAPVSKGYYNDLLSRLKDFRALQLDILKKVHDTEKAQYEMSLQYLKAKISLLNAWAASNKTDEVASKATARQFDEWMGRGQDANTSPAAQLLARIKDSRDRGDIKEVTKDLAELNLNVGFFSQGVEGIDSDYVFQRLLDLLREINPALTDVYDSMRMLPRAITKNDPGFIKLFEGYQEAMVKFDTLLKNPQAGKMAEEEAKKSMDAIFAFLTEIEKKAPEFASSLRLATYPLIESMLAGIGKIPEKYEPLLAKMKGEAEKAKKDADGAEAKADSLDTGLSKESESLKKAAEALEKVMKSLVEVANSPLATNIGGEIVKGAEAAVPAVTAAVGGAVSAGIKPADIMSPEKWKPAVDLWVSQFTSALATGIGAASANLKITALLDLNQLTDAVKLAVQQGIDLSPITEGLSNLYDLIDERIDDRQSKLAERIGDAVYEAFFRK